MELSASPPSVSTALHHPHPSLSREGGLAEGLAVEGDVRRGTEDHAPLHETAANPETGDAQIGLIMSPSGRLLQTPTRRGSFADVIRKGDRESDRGTVAHAAAVHDAPRVSPHVSHASTGESSPQSDCTNYAVYAESKGDRKEIMKGDIKGDITIVASPVFVSPQSPPAPIPLVAGSPENMESTSSAGQVVLPGDTAAHADENGGY